VEGVGQYVSVEQGQQEEEQLAELGDVVEDDYIELH
jgi:hypothetical protein